MKSIYFLIFFFLPVASPAQKDASLRRVQYYNTGLAASVQSYGVLLHAKAKENPAVYKIYEDQYARQQQRIAVLADQWVLRAYSGKKINTALAMVAKSDINGAIKLMEEVLKRKSAEQDEEALLFLAELFELKGDYARAEKLLNGKELSREAGLYHSWLLASLGEMEQALAQTDRLASRFASDTAGLIQIRLQRCFIDTMIKNYAASHAAMVEAQFLLDKMQPGAVRQYWSVLVAGQLAQLQYQGNNIDDAYRNAQHSVAVADELKEVPLQAWAHGVMGRVYKKAGANQQADTHFRASIRAYTELAAAYPQRYEPLLADVMNEYVEVLRWFDRKEESMITLRKIAAQRKQLATGNYPFFTLQYVQSLGRIADLYVFVHNRMDSAETVCKQEKDILAPLYAQYPLLAGEEFSAVLNKLGDINMTLKHYPDGMQYLTTALEVKQKLYEADAETNKQGLMNLLIRNATANGFYGNNAALAYQQLDRAAILAAELKDLRTAGEIEKIKQRIPKK